MIIDSPQPDLSGAHFFGERERLRKKIARTEGGKAAQIKNNLKHCKIYR